MWNIITCTVGLCEVAIRKEWISKEYKKAKKWRTQKGKFVACRRQLSMLNNKNYVVKHINIFYNLEVNIGNVPISISINWNYAKIIFSLCNI